jgi:hypothetical protein
MVLPECAAPLTDRFMRHDNTTGQQHVFDIAVAEGEAEGEPDGMADALRGKAVVLVALGGGGRAHASCPLSPWSGGSCGIHYRIIMPSARRTRNKLTKPTGGYNNYCTRNVIVSADDTKLFVSVGSGTNVDEEKVDEKDPRRAAILEVNPDSSGMRLCASGLRNPVGMDVEPYTKMLWTAVNERDGPGEDLVPDYLTSVRAGAFYGWPSRILARMKTHGSTTSALM